MIVCPISLRQLRHHRLASSAECTVTSRIDSSSFRTERNGGSDWRDSAHAKRPRCHNGSLGDVAISWVCIKPQLLDAYAFVLVVSTKLHFPLASPDLRQRICPVGLAG